MREKLACTQCNHQYVHVCKKCKNENTQKHCEEYNAVCIDCILVMQYNKQYQLTN